MKDAAPRIFRSLEQPFGVAGFDAIVRAAVAAYSSLRVPTQAQARDLARLVVPLWRKVSPHTQRTVAAALSHAPVVPREMVALLVEAPAEIAAPFLVSSPSLTEQDLVHLENGRGPHIARLVAGRRERRVASAAPQEPAASTYPLPEIEAPSLAPEDLSGALTPLSPEEPRPADFVRATLRRLAKASKGPVESEGRTARATLLMRARSQDADRFYALLAELLQLSTEQTGWIEAERQGFELATALKALDISESDALGILMMMKPEIGLDVAAFDRMKATYRELEPGACRKRFGARVWSPSSYARPAAPKADAAPSFGKRRVRPVQKKSGNGS